MAHLYLLCLSCCPSSNLKLFQLTFSQEPTEIFPQFFQLQLTLFPACHNHVENNLKNVNSKCDKKIISCRRFID